jgi:hypothetical protein
MELRGSKTTKPFIYTFSGTNDQIWTASHNVTYYKKEQEEQNKIYG